MARKPKPWYWRKRKLWYVEIDGKRHNLGPDKKDAEKLFHELMSSRQPRIRADSVVAMVDAFLDWCHNNLAERTYEWYQYRLQSFVRTISPSLRTSKLRPFHIQQWVDTEPGWADGSKRNAIRAVKRVMSWAEEQGYIDHNPIARMKKPAQGKREQLVSDAEWEDILNHVNSQQFRDLLLVTWETGARPQETLAVEARHVDLRNCRWVFPQSEEKGKRIPRVVYLTPEAIRITKRLMKKYPQGKLFRNTTGRPWTADAVNCAFVALQIRMGRRSLEQKESPKDKRRKHVYLTDKEVREFAKTLKPNKRSGRKKSEAELMHEARKKLTYRIAVDAATKYSLYAIRHTWMNRLLTSGVDALTVAVLAGHSDTSTLARVYAHLTQDPEYLLRQLRRA